MPKLKYLHLNLGFNDAKSYGLVNTLKFLAEKSYEDLFLSVSNNEFKDADIDLIKKYIPSLIKNNKKFELDFIDTAISKGKMA
jgi:hypothetical protein